MLKQILTAAVLLSLFAGTAEAQEVKPEPAPAVEKPAPARVPPAPGGHPVNVKLDFTISDQTGPGQRAKRIVSMIVADQHRGIIRNAGQVFIEGKGRFDVVLNLEATPVILTDNAIRLSLVLEYTPKPDVESAGSGEGRARLNERLGLIVVPGKPLTVSHAADPTSDRQIAVELVASVLK
jgi:hypothetical protein